MNLYEVLLYLYPNADPLAGDFALEGDEKTGEQRIVRWNEPKLGPQPTQAQLQAGRFGYAKHAKKAEGANRMHRENRALYSEVSGEGWLAEMFLDAITEPRGSRVASVKANKDKRARFYALVDAAPSVEAVQALVWESA